MSQVRCTQTLIYFVDQLIMHILMSESYCRKSKGIIADSSVRAHSFT